MDIEVFTNFAVAVSTMTLSLTLIRMEIKVARLVVLATIYSIFFTIVKTQSLEKINMLIISVFLSIGISWERGLRGVLICILTNIAVTAALTILIDMLSKIYNQPTITPLLIAMAVLIISIIIDCLIKLVTGYVKKQNNTYKIELIYKKAMHISQGFYDSGNTAKKDGLPIIILNNDIAKLIDFSPTDSVAVMTVGGIKNLKTAPMQLKVYFEDGSNILYEVFGATSNFTKKSSVILNAEMRRYL